MESISYSRVQAALRAMGIGDHKAVSSVSVTPHEVIVFRHDLKDGKSYLDPSTEQVAVVAEMFPIDYAKRPDTDGSGLTYAAVTLVHNNGVTYEFRVDTDTEYEANISDVLADVDRPFGGEAAAKWDNTSATTIDFHLYGKGVASQTVGPAAAA